MDRPGYHNSEKLAAFLERLGEMDLPTRDEIECRRMRRRDNLEEQVAPE